MGFELNEAISLIASRIIVTIIILALATMPALSQEQENSQLW